ncbi:MAG: AAA family ATPase [Pseudomonadota bacterium]
MYEAFYKLERQPFVNIPDPGALFLSPSHQRALSVLQYSLMTRAGFCVVTGEVGAGKTTLVRRLLQVVDPSLEVGLVSNTQCESFDEFLQWVFLSFDLDFRSKDKVELYADFVAFLIERYDAGCPVTLIIDEAQHLGPDYLEQLRMLSNINTEKGLLLQTILVGQPELWDILRRTELRQFAQRISYDYHLGPLDGAEMVGQYISHRVEASGGDPELFEQETLEPIFQASRGIPRLINLLCDTALVYGFAEQKTKIDLPLIAQVLKDKMESFAPFEAVDQELLEPATETNPKTAQRR